MSFCRYVGMYVCRYVCVGMVVKQCGSVSQVCMQVGMQVCKVCM